MSKTALRDKLDTLIREEWRKQNGTDYPSEYIPESTLRKYINDVHTLQAFNSHTSVSNKTESRFASEFSIRSTISFMLVVLSTHYINAQPTKYHRPTSMLEKDPIYMLIKKLNKEVLGITDLCGKDYFLTHVLPSLITSTDECTVFISSKIINGKELWYFTCCPNNSNKPHVDSNKRDNFTTDLTGDAHHRGLRIVLNNTFTAGGMCAPVFACVYGLNATEMPGDEIVYRPIKGLVAGSGQTGDMREGYLVFVRGKYETLEEYQAKQSQNDLPITSCAELEKGPKTMSKEARVAKLYRDLIYYPLIKHIRTAYYGMEENSQVPDNLTAISWLSWSASPNYTRGCVKI